MSQAVVVKGTTTDKTSVPYMVRGSQLVVVVSISAGAGSLVVTINGKTSSGYVYPMLVSSSLTGVGVTPLRIFPGATSSPNAVSNDVLPDEVFITVAVTGSVTYGIDAISGG